MASSYGEDAAVTALRSAYESVTITTRLSPSYRRRICASIVSHLCDTRVYREAPLVLGYVAMREEFDCRPILQRALSDGKDVALPIMDVTGTMSFSIVADLDSLVRRGGSTLCPDPNTSRAIPADLGLAGSICLVPGLVFDAAGYRIAYGAGWWDNYLRTYGGTKIGLVRAMQVGSNPLPHDDHDVAVDVLVTESAVWVCRR